MNYATILTALTLCVKCFTQTQENFTDGNLHSNPEWVGDTVLFEINESYKLQLNDQSAGAAALFTTAQFDAGSDQEWRFEMQLDFAPSSSNQAEFWLIGDTLMENGVFIRVGESGSNDAIRLFEMMHGNETEIFSGAFGDVGGPFEADFLIRRLANGTWRIWKTQNGDQSFVGAGVESIPPTGQWLGLHCDYTSSNADGFLFDNLYHGPVTLDTLGPTVTSFAINSGTALKIQFNEPLDTNQVLANSFFNFSPALTIDEVEFTDQHEVSMSFSESLVSRQLYQLNLTGLTDTAGNQANQLLDSIIYYYVQEAEFGDVIINEILADPEPSIGLPEVEYVEIYNRSNKTFNTENWLFTDGSSEGSFENQLIFPNEFLVFCKSGCADSIVGAIELSAWPSLNNAGDQLALQNADSIVLDSVTYADDWFGPVDKNGRSLERINPTLICSDANNWKPSESSVGGTPGKENEVQDSLHLLSINQVKSFQFLSDTQLQIEFMDWLDSAKLDGIHLEFDGLVDLGSIQMNERFAKQAQINLANAAPFSQPFQLVIANWPNCNELPNVSVEHQFVRPEEPIKGDLVINELLFDPYTGGNDFVEVFNRTEKFILLDDFQVKRLGEEGELLDSGVLEQQYILAPHDLLVLSENGLVLQDHYPNTQAEKLLDMDLPNFPNDSGIVVLLNKSNVIDSFAYSSDMHFRLLESGDGKSLERMSAESATNQWDNWHTAAESVGFATPGRTNSQHYPYQQSGEVILTTNVVSPDQDGYQDVLQVNYKLQEPGFLINVTIYSKWGVPVVQLKTSELVSPEGTLFWDGLLPDGVKASIGEYVLLFEAIHSTNGITFAQKLPIVVAGKM